MLEVIFCRNAVARGSLGFSQPEIMLPTRLSGTPVDDYLIRPADSLIERRHQAAIFCRLRG